MPDDTQSGLRPAAQADAHGGRRVNGWLVALALVAVFGVGATAAWRWIDSNVLQWGVQDGRTVAVNQAELVRQVQAFELATVKNTYAGRAHVDADKVLRAGPKRLTLPGWVAGQELDVQARVTVTAGVDLSGVRPEDMEITRRGKDVQVIIHVPAPEVLSTELVPDTLDMSTSSGVITRVRRSVGLEEPDLRDRAADEVSQVARSTAVEQGILDDAARETERRLQRFLQSLPQTGSERVTYTVIVRDQKRS
jgi:hypothetical protein